MKNVCSQKKKKKSYFRINNYITTRKSAVAYTHDS